MTRQRDPRNDDRDADPAADPAADWQAPLRDLEERRDRAREMGGAERIERLMTARGKLNARDRIALLFDPGTFREVGTLVGGRSVPADALIAGLGRIDGRPALAAAEDFTVLGGSIGMASMAKRYRICELALQEGVPLVFMLDGAGHRLTDTHTPGRVPNDLLALADLSGRVPMVCLVLGASAGHGALAAPLCDFTIMTRSASMFTGGPPLVKMATGEEVTKEELGGAEMCASVAGTAHAVCEDDLAAIALARRYLGYFASPLDAPPHVGSHRDTGPRLLEGLLEIIPVDDRKPYDMHRVIELLVDDGDYLESQPDYGRSLVTALARLGGRSVAVVANNPAAGAGAVDSPAAIKAAEFIETVGAFRLPVIFLADNPGVLTGTKAERSGILKWAGRMFQAQRRLESPKLHVTMRKAFGFGASTMAHNPFDRQTLCLALPTVTMTSMPAAGGAAAAKLDSDEQQRLEDHQSSGPWSMAAGMGYDDVIDPRELRNALLDGLSLIEGRES